MLSSVYRFLLRLSGPADRQDQAAEMEALFRHCVEREVRRHGRRGMVVAVVNGVLDAVIFAARTRWGSWKPRDLLVPAERFRRTSVVLHDLRGTLRLLRSQPALSLAVIGMLALGIGSTTAIFSVVYGVLLKPLPFPDSDRLVQVYGSNPSRGWTSMSLTEANFWDLHDRNRTLDAFGIFAGTSFSLTGFEQPERLSGGRVTTGFFRSLGVRCMVGRLFEPGEDEPGRADRLVLLSHGFWARRFAGDLNVVGRTITLDSQPYSIVGVLPPGSPWLNAADVFVPFVRRPNPDRSSFEYAGVARMKPGVTVDAALADLSAIAKDLEARFADTNQGLGVVLQPSREWVANSQLRRTLWILLGAVSLLLLIACLNVTNLLLARASARARENALRTALGAGRSDLVRERLIESLVYALAGMGLGWFLASWMIDVLRALAPTGLPRLDEMTLNGWVLLFAAFAALAVGLLTGLVPALCTPIGDIVPVLRQAARGATGDRGHSRMRSILVGAEVALALMLLVGAGLLVRSLIGVLSVDRGFQTENRLLVTISVPSSYGPDRLARTNSELIERLKSLPAVHAVAAVSGRPLSRGSTGLGIGAADKPEPPGGAVPWSSWRVITPDYFHAMGLRVLAGRSFTDQDLLAKPWRAIISKRTADLLWPGENPIGKTAILWKGQSNVRGEIIGVVSDMRERGLESNPTLAVYFPAGGAMGTTTLQVVLHTRTEPAQVVPAVRAVVANVDPNLPVSNIRTLDEIVAASVAMRRLTMSLLAAFAGLAVVLALAGVYAVLAYSVTRRTAEIGVRLALGAEHHLVLRAIVRQGLRPVAAGCVIGLAVAAWMSGLMTSLLFEVRPYDPLTYAVVTIAIVGAATLACYIPARRVLRVDPAIALRVE